MNLVPVSEDRAAWSVLYDLLAERPRQAWISHAILPSPSEHDAFVASHPFRYWYLIDNAGTYVGAIECTDRNEIGVHILKKFQRKGFAYMALTKFISSHEPMPPVKAIRNGHWLANIAICNGDGKDFFKRMGFEPLQETWVKV